LCGDGSSDRRLDRPTVARGVPLWGAPRIHGELLKLGVQISQATVFVLVILALERRRVVHVAGARGPRGARRHEFAPHPARVARSDIRTDIIANGAYCWLSTSFNAVSVYEVVGRHGCDLHASQQSIAMLYCDAGTGIEKALKHEGEAVREF
jgi:hypothetical protein